MVHRINAEGRAEQRIGLNEQKQQHENLPSQFIESISICTLYANVKTLNPFKRSINIFPFFYMFLLFLLSICHQHWWKSENQGTTKTKDVKEKRNTLTEDEKERREAKINYHNTSLSIFRLVFGSTVCPLIQISHE